MAISTDLLQFLDKPAGVYRLTKDNSTINTAGNAPVTPLVIGFSKNGTFNSPVYCPDQSTFNSIFGSIDRSLERKGSFFHRTAYELLTVGPVIALNLFNLNNTEPISMQSASLTDPTYDLTNFKAVSVGASFTSQPTKINVYSRFFNTDKFWFPDSEKLNEFASLNNTDALLSFVNVSQKPATVLVRKASNVTGFNVTLTSWFGQAEVPSYLNGSDYVSDFFVDVIVLSGDYTNYASLSIDPILGGYFDANGLIMSKLDAFLRLNQVVTLGSYTGCLIPEFTDKTGVTMSIDGLVNQDTSRTGIVCAINHDYLDSNLVSGQQFDMVGHNIYGFYQNYLSNNTTNVIDFASYKGKVVTPVRITGLGITQSVSYMTVTGSANDVIKLTIPSNTTDPGYISVYNAVLNNTIKRGGIIKFAMTDGTVHNVPIYLYVTDARITGSNAVITFHSINWASYGLNPASVSLDVDSTITTIATVPGYSRSEFNSYFSFAGASHTQPKIVIPHGTVTTGFITTLAAAAKNEISAGDIFSIQIQDTVTPVAATNYDLVITSYSLATNGDLTINFADINYAGIGFNQAGVIVVTTGTAYSFKQKKYIFEQDIKPWVEFETITTSGLSSNQIVIDSNTFGPASNSNIRIGGYVMSTYDSINYISTFTKIKKITSIGTLNAPAYKVETEGPIALVSSRIVYSDNLLANFTSYNLFSLFGFRIKDRMIPDNTNDRMNEIYGVLDSTNISRTLIDKKAITFRYIVDTFNHGIESSSKGKLSQLAKDRQNAFAILNTPTMKEFAASVDPIFTELPTSSNPKPNIDLSFVVSGGNLSNSPSYLYTLPSEEEGAAYSAFYAPNVLVRERGKVLSIPPAMYVAKLFVLKHLNYKAWSILAGTRRGVIFGNGVIGVDYAFDDTDRGFLENFGINPIVFESGVGLTITSNSTAKQTTKSSLSQINGTEVLIYIQDRVASILKKYVWEFNTPELELEVKTIVDQELEQVKIDGGIYDYLNVMNSSNNTNETIDNLLGILDSYIEVTKGMAKAIHRTTIEKTGQIATGIL